MSEPTSDPIRNLAVFIDAAKRSVALKEIDFDAWHWTFSPDDVVAKKMNRHRSYSNTLTFSNRETSTAKFARVPASDRAPMTEPYLNFSKADVRLYAESNNVGIDVLRRRLCAHQFLERVLRDRYSSAEIGRVTLSDFELAEDALKTELGAKTSYKVSNQLQAISELIDSRRFIRGAIQYRTRLKRPNDGDELTEEGETEGIAKMISQEALDMLADISSDPLDDRQRFLIRIVDLMVCSGFRVGEVLRLPFDCLVEGSGEPRVCPRRGIKLSSVGKVVSQWHPCRDKIRYNLVSI